MTSPLSVLKEKLSLATVNGRCPCNVLDIKTGKDCHIKNKADPDCGPCDGTGKTRTYLDVLLEVADGYACEPEYPPKEGCIDCVVADPRLIDALCAEGLGLEVWYSYDASQWHLIESKTPTTLPAYSTTSASDALLDAMAEDYCPEVKRIHGNVGSGWEVYLILEDSTLIQVVHDSKHTAIALCYAIWKQVETEA